MQPRRPKNGRESVPNTLRPEYGYVPVPTLRQQLAQALSEQRKQAVGVKSVPGGRLSPRALALQGKPCPGGWNNEEGYNYRGCRCEGCRADHVRKRRERWRAAKARAA